MALTHTWAITVKDDTGTALITDSIVITGDVNEKVNEAVAANTVKEIDIAVPVSLLNSFFIECDKAVTIKLNSATTPASPSPLSLVAARAYGWKNTDPGSNPLTVVITKIFVDNSANGSVATFKAGFLMTEGV